MSPAFVRRLITVIVAIGLLVAAVLFMVHIPRTVSIFLIAAFIAFGAIPLVRRLATRMPRPLAIAIVYLGMLGFLVVVALLIIPVTYAQVAALIVRAPEYVNASQDIVGGLQRLVHERLGAHVPLPSTADVQAQVGSRVEGAISAVFASVGAIVLGTVSALFVCVSALILSVFFVSRGSSFGLSLLEFVPPARRAEVAALFDEITHIFGHFVAGQVFLCTVVGLIVWLSLLPVHFGLALLVAVVCALGYSVPFVGMLAAQVIAAVLAIPQGTGMVVYVTVAIFVISRVADSLLVPKIMSESVGVSPIAVMFAVFAGGELFGLPGLVLGIPAAALIKLLFKYFVQPYVVRMQLRDLAHMDLGNVHVDVEVDDEDGNAHPPESVAVVVTP
jgi:predicted PurR-regulated permease PerM